MVALGLEVLLTDVLRSQRTGPPLSDVRQLAAHAWWAFLEVLAKRPFWHDHHSVQLG